MIVIKNSASVRKMEEAGQKLIEIFDAIASDIVVDNSTGHLDKKIASMLIEKGLVSRMKGYMGYGYVSCISVNDEVVHGVPSFSTVLKEGDVVKVDVCASWRGYCADMARCFFVGEVSEETKRFITNAQEALNKGIAQARKGNRLGDISAAIQRHVESGGFGVVREFAGHGIGKQMHEEPEVLNYGKAGTGPILQPGMAFALEPMTTMGKYDVYVDENDSWTVRTSDKSLAAHVEDTIVVTEDEPKIITRSARQKSVA